MNGSPGIDEEYGPEHALAALARTRRAGASARHEDTEELAVSVADALLHLQLRTWDFGDSVCFEALVAASDALGHERWARFAHGWGRAWATRSKPFTRLDCTLPGRVLVGLAVRYGDQQLLHALRDLADYLMSRPTLDGVYESLPRAPLLSPYSGVPLDERQKALLDDPPPGVFVDCMHFDPPFLIALGLTTGESRYRDAGVEQALGYIQLLQREDGLFDHFVLRGQTGTFGPGWGRGQGWAVLGLLDVVEKLGQEDGSRATIVGSARRLLESMAALQRSDGHWHAVVTDPESGDEFSTAAFMARAFSEGLRLGVVSGDQPSAALALARQAVIGSLDAEGRLREVSAAVYASTAPSHYGCVPRGYVVPWGQGPALLALISGKGAP